MSATNPDDPSSDPSTRQPSPYVDVQQSAEFAGLKRALRRFVFPMTAAFLLWYALYVLMSAFARDFMGTKVVGNINVALIFGLLQFVTTFVIAWLYERYSTRRLEPVAERLRVIVEHDQATAARQAKGESA